MTRNHPELGPEKLCAVCGEWWPLDQEFWYFTVKPAGQVIRSRGRNYTRTVAVRHIYSRCRACWAERSAAQYARIRARATWDNDPAEYSGPITHTAQRPSVRLYSEREGVGFREYRPNA